MAINLRIVKDEGGNLRVNTDDSYGPLAWYLEQDIQSDLEHGEQMLEICSRIINQDGEWSGTGNAHSVTVTRIKVRIENEFVEGATGVCELGLDGFRESLSSWLQAVRSKDAIILNSISDLKPANISLLKRKYAGVRKLSSIHHSCGNNPFIMSIQGTSNSCAAQVAWMHCNLKSGDPKMISRIFSQGSCGFAGEPIATIASPNPVP